MSFAKKILALVVSNGLHAASHVAILVVCSRYLTQFEYGSYRQFFTIYEIAVPVLGIGLSQTVFYFFARTNSRWLVVKRVLCVLVAAITIFSIALLFFGSYLAVSVFHNEILLKTFPLLLPFTFFSLVIPILSAVLIDAGDAKKLAIFSSGYVVILALSVSFTAVEYKDASLVIGARVLVASAFSLALYWYCRSVYFLSDENGNGVLSCLDLVRYSAPLGAASAVGIVSQQVDKIIVSALTSPEKFAIYVNGAMEIPLISVLTGALATASISELSRKAKEGQNAEALMIFKRVASISSLVLMPAFVFFFVMAESFMVLLFGEKYAESAIPFRIYLLLIPARVVFFGPVLIAFGKTRAVLIRSAIEFIFTAILSVLLVMNFGYIGGAVAMVIVTYAWSVAYNLAMLKDCFLVDFVNLLPFRELGRRLLTSFFAIPVLFLANFIEGGGGLMRFSISFALYVIALLSILFFLKDQDFLNAVRFLARRR